MSEYAHTGQILPIENQMIPISKHTSFHASFDNHLDGFNQGRRVRPVGPTKSIYIDRNHGIRGEFGSGINPRETGFYISLWVKPDAATPNQILFGFDRRHNSNARLYLGIHAGTWSMAVGTHTWRQTAATVRNEWAFIEIEGTGGNITLRVDGVVAQSGTHSAFELGNFGIGENIGHGDYDYLGHISDMKIYFGDRLTAHYPCDEAGGHVLYDASGNGNDCTAVLPMQPGIGPTVASIQKNGRFGNAVHIEHATRNIIINDSWNSDSSTVSIKKTDTLSEFGHPVYVWEPVGASGTANTYLNGTADLDSTTSNTWTFSMYLKRMDGKPVTSVGSMYIHTLDGDGNRVNDSRPPDAITYHGDGWYRITRTREMSERQPMYLVGVSALSRETAWLISDMQLETGIIASSPVGISGERSHGFLEYPIEVLNPKEGTIAFWGRLPYELPYSEGGQNMHMSTTGGLYGTAHSLTMQMSSAYPTRIVGIHWGSVSGDSNHTSVTSTGVREYHNGDWNHFTITWHRDTGWRLYINGHLEASAGTSLPLKPFDADTIRFMGMQMDELRIEDIVISDDEIKAWAASGAHYNYLDYTLEAE